MLPADDGAVRRRNVSTCGFSSGGALALGIAAHNSALGKPLPQPRHIVAVSGEVPWNDAEKARMQALNSKDVAIDYAFMVTVEKFMRHGQDGVPDYMISGSRGDFSGVGDIHFFYSSDEVLYGALPDFEEACKRADVPVHRLCKTEDGALLPHAAVLQGGKGGLLLRSRTF